VANPPIIVGELVDVPAPGSSVLSAFHVEVANRVVQRFATVTDRDTKWPAATAGKGAVAVVLSNLGVYVSDGAAWQAFGPMGYVAHAAAVTPFTTTGTHTTAQDSGMSVTVTEPANRRWKITVAANPYAVAPAAILLTLVRAGVTVHEWAVPAAAVDNATSHGSTFVRFVPSTAGGIGIVYKLQLRSAAASAVIDYGSAITPRLLLIEDVGPA
jgi:hypothetical protein